MKTIRSAFMVLMVTVLFLSACAPKAIPPAAVVSPQPDGSLVVTLDDQGKTVSLQVGQSFLLKLGETYNWDVTISDQAVVSRVKGIAVIRGAQGVYQALQAGTASMSASGDPQCRQDQPPCTTPGMEFSVSIVVK